VAAFSFQREYSALRVRALDDPTAARQFKRVVENLAPSGLYVLRGNIDITDAEIIKPEGDRHK
jgi:hypothetical protein